MISLRLIGAVWVVCLGAQAQAIPAVRANALQSRHHEEQAQFPHRRPERLKKLAEKLEQQYGNMNRR